MKCPRLLYLFLFINGRYIGETEGEETSYSRNLRKEIHGTHWDGLRRRERWLLRNESTPASGSLLHAVGSAKFTPSGG